jgi:hypothetical protein
VTEDLIGYSDLDRADDPDNRKSVSGYMFKLCDTPILWRSKKQLFLCGSSIRSATQLKELSELPIEQSRPTVVYEDNQSAIANAGFHGRTKYINICHREKVNGAEVLLFCRYACSKL